jgi:hypothetical protein
MSETIETVTVKNLENGGFSKVKIIQRYWASTSPITRRFIIGYGIITIFCCTAYTYTDGKNALIKYRADHPSTSTVEGEWEAIKNNMNTAENFWSALFFPWSIAGKVMPSIVLLMNPKTQN